MDRKGSNDNSSKTNNVNMNGNNLNSELEKESLIKELTESLNIDFADMNALENNDQNNMKKSLTTIQEMPNEMSVQSSKNSEVERIEKNSNDNKIEDSIIPNYFDDENNNNLISFYGVNNDIESIVKNLQTNETMKQDLSIIEDDYLEVEKFEPVGIDEILNIVQSVNQNDLQDAKKGMEMIDLDGKTISKISDISYLLYRAQDIDNKDMEDIKKQMEDKNDLFAWRDILPGSDSFFRAVMFSFLEDIILKRNINDYRTFLYELSKNIENNYFKKILSFYQIDCTKAKIVLILIYFAITIQDIELSIEKAHSLLVKIYNFDMNFDFLLILNLKFLIYKYLKNNERKLYNKEFSVPVGSLLPNKYKINNKYNFRKFYENNLLQLNKDAERITISVIPFILRRDIFIYSFEQKKVNNLWVHADEKENKEITPIRIFLINGSYEIVYQKEYYNKFQKAFSIFSNFSKSDKVTVKNNNDNIINEKILDNIEDEDDIKITENENLKNEFMNDNKNSSIPHDLNHDNNKQSINIDKNINNQNNNNANNKSLNMMNNSKNNENITNNNNLNMNNNMNNNNMNNNINNKVNENNNNLNINNNMNNNINKNVNNKINNNNLNNVNINLNSKNNSINQNIASFNVNNNSQNNNLNNNFNNQNNFNNNNSNVNNNNLNQNCNMLPKCNTITNKNLRPINSNYNSNNVNNNNMNNNYINNNINKNYNITNNYNSNNNINPNLNSNNFNINRNNSANINNFNENNKNNISINNRNNSSSTPNNNVNSQRQIQIKNINPNETQALEAFLESSDERLKNNINSFKNMNKNNSENKANFGMNNSKECPTCRKPGKDNFYCENCLFNHLLQFVQSSYIAFIKNNITNLIKQKPKENLTIFLSNLTITFPNQTKKSFSESFFLLSEKDKNIFNEKLNTFKTSLCLGCFNLINKENYMSFNKKIATQKIVFKFPCGCSFCSPDCLNRFINAVPICKITSFICACGVEYDYIQLKFLLYFALSHNLISFKNEILRYMYEIIKNKCCKCRKEIPLIEGKKNNVNIIEIKDEEGEKIFGINKFMHLLCDKCNKTKDIAKNKFYCELCSSQHTILSKKNIENCQIRTSCSIF